MSGRKSKDKGSAGERALCKRLGEVFGGSFIRSANSGAYVGGKNAWRRNTLSEGQVRGTKADIIPPDFMPRLVIESKWYAEFPYHQFLTSGPIALLDGWIAQTLDAVDDGDFWFLAFRANRREWSACFDVAHEALFALKTYVRYTDAAGKRYVVTNLDEFVTTNRDVILRLTG